ncbi:hypothetical protein BC628DRAFT_1516154 [Trametes gibbosa]|nr:hypothetical protein BC628DRAFT_1516154 [Trametes gibbosa]
MISGSGQTYGQHLPDQVERISALSDAQLEVLADVSDLHKERAALEREYATKLQILAKKASEKKAKKMPALVVGSEPTKAWDESTLMQSTLDRAYTQLIAAITDSSRDHIILADSLATQVIEPLKATGRKYDEAKKKQMQYYQKLLVERDRVYADRMKSKQKYDEECAEVETYRQKQERSADDRHAERAARQYEQQQEDMLNSKNAYLISITIANKIKDKFYSEDLPALEDQFQDFHSRLLSCVIEILKNAQSIQLKHLDTLRSHLTETEAALCAVSPQADQDLFINYNIAPFMPPSDWVFEPSAVHYDHGDMIVGPASKVYLQNRLSRCRAKLEELGPVLSSKRNETEQLGKLVVAHSANDALGTAGEVLDSYLDAQHELTFYGISRVVLSTELDTISLALNGDEGAQSPHSFKSSSSPIPTTCAYCKSSIWGLSKQGKTCKACGISVHSKCELKLPADCTGTRHGGGGHGLSDSVSSISSVSRASSVISREHTAADSSALATLTPSSFARASPMVQEKEPSARVLFNFAPTSPFELAVSAESMVHVLEEDDGSGWVKVADDSGAKGLVPASYVELLEAASALGSSTSSSESQQSAGEYVKGVYAYEARGPDELDVEEGMIIRLTEGQTGGRNYADGWWEGVCTLRARLMSSGADSALILGSGVGANGKRGIFPSNYVKQLYYLPERWCVLIIRCR